jgi:hypothetical protein
MGLELPGALASLLDILGYKWPAGDEAKLFELGQKWSHFSDPLKQIAQAGDQAASAVWSSNAGSNITAFANHWKAGDGPSHILHEASDAANLIGTGMSICAAIMLALKVNVITQLATLFAQIAQAIASAVATFGASLSEIPIFQQVSRMIVGQLIDQVIAKLANA